jgi:protein-tyrosine-phosphatase
MASPLSPMEAVEIVERALALYKKIKDLPEQITKIAKRMEGLNIYLHELQDILDTKKNPGGLASLRPVNVTQLNHIIKDIKADGQKVYDLLYRWEKNIGPGGLVWRFDWVAHLVYGLGSSPDKLDALGADIEKHLNDINRFILVLISFAANKQLMNKMRPPPPSPILRPKSPIPASQEVNILFVDGFNTGRSKVAEAYCHLLSKWTIQISGAPQWKIRRIYSAGILPSNKTSYAQELVDLGEKLTGGDVPPNSSAVDSLFNNTAFDFPFKETIKKQISSSRSRGLPSDLFSTFDFVIVFTRRHELKLIKLRELLLEKFGSSARPRKKGKIVLLGDYLTGKPGSEIYEPADKLWSNTTAVIKLSTRSFLQKEIGWVRPTPDGKTAVKNTAQN